MQSGSDASTARSSTKVAVSLSSCLSAQHSRRSSRNVFFLPRRKPSAPVCSGAAAQPFPQASSLSNSSGSRIWPRGVQIRTSIKPSCKSSRAFFKAAAAVSRLRLTRPAPFWPPTRYCIRVALSTKDNRCKYLEHRRQQEDHRRHDPVDCQTRSRHPRSSSFLSAGAFVTLSHRWKPQDGR